MNFIKLRKKNLCVENISTFFLAKKYKTPFYCYSLSQLKNNFYSFSKAFRSVKPIICFSVKSNANVSLLKELKKIGSGADVVSAGELLKATKAGINVKKIVFSGVGKTEDEIKLAINNLSSGSLVLLDDKGAKTNLSLEYMLKNNFKIINETREQILLSYK